MCINRFTEKYLFFYIKYCIMRQLRPKVGYFYIYNLQFCEHWFVFQAENSKSFIFPKKLNFSNVSNLSLFPCSFSFWTKHCRDKKIISNFSHSETQHFIIPRHSDDDHQLSVSEIVLFLNCENIFQWLYSCQLSSSGT